MKNRFENPMAVKEQYATDKNLSARQGLHHYNTNKVDWHSWFFEKMEIPHGARILEVGCGNGLLWQKNHRYIRDDWSIILSDFSEGMLESARQNIDDERIQYEIIDIQDIPYDDDSFDVVIARHMLYHVPQLDKALQDVKRVLKPKGRFYVSTNGFGHMGELAELIRSFDSNIAHDPDKLSIKFGLENGAEILGRHFGNVDREEFCGRIVVDVDKVEPVVSYIKSMFGMRYNISYENLYKHVECEFGKTDKFEITTRAGMFAASH